MTTSAIVNRVVAGVDGCKGRRWVAASAGSDGGRISIDVFDSVRAVLDAFPPPALIAVDVPIGLTDRDRRTCDVEARQRLGGPRASSVFATPIRGILAATTRAEASRLHQGIDGRGYGAQAWAILPSIVEWDRQLQKDRNRLDHVFEVHPEICFWALNGERPMRVNKKEEAGAAERRGLLEGALGADAVGDALTHCDNRRAEPDDVLDALVALWTAKRIAQGVARSIPAPPEVDSMGIPMAMWY